MNAEEIKAAAHRITDLERVEQILSDIRKGSAFVLQCGTNTIPLDKNTSGPVFQAIEHYLTSASRSLKQQLGGVEGIEDPFDAALANLEAEARPQ